MLFWALVIVVCVKYIGFILPVDHDGEGGILALLALGSPSNKRGRPVATGVLTTIVVVGAAMLLGDGSITPAISVISAIEGVKQLSPSLAAYIVPCSILVLIGMFAVQRYGTGHIGRIFGPVMLVWFAMLAVAGSISIARNPMVLAALNPWYAVQFMQHHGISGFLGLGGIVLAITGVEALYANLFHFGRRPIFLAWYVAVFPALVLCYFGEIAAILRDGSALDAPFYTLTPGVWLIPSILIATLATIIASQALISGAFTLVEQAIALGLAPRMRVLHTSAEQRGQVYIPAVNTLLAIGCIMLVIAFRSSDRLASAFGLAVSCTMLATSIAWYAVVTRRNLLKRPIAMIALVCFIAVDGSFVVAGLPKFADGGWVPFLVSAVLTALTLVWLWGRRRLTAALSGGDTALSLVLAQTADLPKVETPPVVLLTPDPDRIPLYALHPWVAERVAATSLVLLHVEAVAVPRVPHGERVAIRRLSPRITVIEARIGYMEPPRIHPIVLAAQIQGLDLSDKRVVFAYTLPVLEPVGQRSLIRKFAIGTFSVLFRNARRLSDDLGIPANRCVALGMAVKI